MKDAIIKHLKAQIGDVEPDMYEELYGEYRSTASERIAQLEENLATMDMPELKRIAHALKGEAMMVGDVSMMEAALAFEACTKNGDEAGCRQQFEVIQKSFSQLED